MGPVLFYRACAATDPVAELRRRPRADAGRFRCLTAALIEALHARYQAHPGWSVQLHYDNNLVALLNEQLALQPLASYSTIRRYLKARDWVR